MNVLLVRPPSPALTIVPPIGLGYLATSLDKSGHNVSILDCLKDKISYRRLRKKIKKYKPDVVGFNMFSCDLDSVKKCIEIVKEIDESIITIVGGAHPSGAPKSTMNILPKVDFGFKGEAEIGLPKLLKKLENGNRDFKNVDGLIWRKDGKVIVNRQSFVKNLDQLGFPKWDLIPPNKYPRAPHGGFSKDFPIAPIITSRGCPYRCTFCAAYTIGGRKIRMRSAEHVVDEIQYLYEKFGVKEIHIEDDNFVINKERVKKICDLLLQRNIDISWACPNGVRLDALDEDVLRKMKRSGCYSLAIGIESGSPNILKDMKKGLTPKVVREKLKLINKVGIYTTGLFILGYPTESLKDIKKTIQFSKELNIQFARFATFIPLPGSEAYSKLEKKEIDKIDWNKMYAPKIPYSPPSISYEQLKGLQKYAYLSFYLRPKILINLLKMLSLQNLINVFKIGFNLIF